MPGTPDEFENLTDPDFFDVLGFQHSDSKEVESSSVDGFTFFFCKDRYMPMPIFK